jgi:hypothetical protein
MKKAKKKKKPVPNVKRKRAKRTRSPALTTEFRLFEVGNDRFELRNTTHTFGPYSSRVNAEKTLSVLNSGSKKAPRLKAKPMPECLE